MLYEITYRKREHYEYVSVGEIKEILEDIHKMGGCVIYGAGRYAVAVLECLDAIDESISVLGIVVSDRKGNPTELKGYDVREIDEYNETKYPVLIATQECWQEDIFNNLKRRGFDRVIPISQLHINMLGEMYYREKLRMMGIETNVLDLMNIKRFHKDYWKNRFNNMCDLFENIKVAMYRRAAEETADYVVENMLNRIFHRFCKRIRCC